MPPNASANSDGITNTLFASPSAQLGEHLQVFVAQELPVWFALVDRGEDRVDRLGFSLRAKDRRLALASASRTAAC